MLHHGSLGHHLKQEPSVGGTGGGGGGGTGGGVGGTGVSGSSGTGGTSSAGTSGPYTPSTHPFSINRLLPTESKSEIKMYADMQYGYNTLSPLSNTVHPHAGTASGLSSNDYYNSSSLYAHATQAGTTSL